MTKNEIPTQFEWIQLKHEIDSQMPIESTEEKFMRKFKSNPVVPIGALATAAILSVGIYSFKRGNTQLSQRLMRYRVLAQGITLVTLIGGIAFTGVNWK